MIYLYSGSPGSGKSLHVARDIYYRLNKSRNPRNVIANFNINKKMIKSDKSNFIYKDNSDLTVEFLVNYSIENHIIGKENQTLVVVDECQVIWNSRQWQDNKNRMDWIKFFTQHRKLGFNFIVISQNDRMIDRQIRALFEYEVKHRKVNNFKIGKLLPFSTFASISYWYGVNEKLGTEFFTYRKKWGQFYDSYGTFEIDSKIKSMINKNDFSSSASGGDMGTPPEQKKKFNLFNKLNFSNKKDKFIMTGYISSILFCIYKVIVNL